MKRLIISNIALILLFAGTFMFYRGHKNKQVKAIIERVEGPLLSPIAKTKATIETYEGAKSVLWLDRSYFTEKDVPELMGMQYLRVHRDSRERLSIEVKRKTTLYALGNKEIPNNYSNWELTDIDVFVYDGYTPRTMNAVYKMEFKPGVYALSFPIEIPSPPVFFKKGDVKLLGK